MREIKINNGFSAIVDDEDYKKLSKYKWCIVGPEICKYAVRYKAKSGIGERKIYMHREIMNLGHWEKGGIVVDHINGNGLDNRKINLRKATQWLNTCNRGITRKNTSGYKGVFVMKKGMTWRAKIGYDGGVIGLGTFYSPGEAAKAYDKKAKELFGEFAKLNFN